MGIFFYDFVVNSVRKFFLPTGKHRKAKFCLFLGICCCSCSFTAKISSFETVESRPKTTKIRGHSELWEPIRTRENSYPLIWWILIAVYRAFSHDVTSAMNNQTAAMLVSLPFLWEWRSFHLWLLAPLQKSAYSKPSIMKMQIREKWRKLSVNQEIPCVYPFPGYCSCSDTRNICMNRITLRD